MQWYDRIRQVKFLLVVMAIVIAVGSLIISNYLVRDLALGEHQNMEVWAEAMRTLNNADENTDVTLALKVLEIIPFRSSCNINQEKYIAIGICH